MGSLRDDPPIIPWAGEYRFVRDRSFVDRVASVSNRYTSTKIRTAEADFYAELARLRSHGGELGGELGRVLLAAQLEHRWRHPNCAISLYALTVSLHAPAAGAYATQNGKPVHGAGRLSDVFRCTKVGKTERSLAVRMKTYVKDPLAGFNVVPGSQNLCVAIYGEDDTTMSEDDRMPDERRMKHEARIHGGEYPWCFNAAGKPQIRGRGELFVGVEIAEHIRSFAHRLPCQ